MDLTTLKNKLRENKVPESWYSLYDGLKGNAWMLWEIHGMWEVYYMDERGGQMEDNRHLFISEETACDFLWEKMANALKYSQRPPDGILPK